MTKNRLRAADGTAPKMSKEVLSFGILGCGMIADIHADAIKTLSGARLTGAADKNAEGAADFAKRHNIKACKSFEEMLSSKDTDAVCICTPSGFHAKNAVKALNAGKHVVLEKPMALSSEQAHEIIAACKQSGKLLTVISQLRFSEDVQKIKRLLSEGAFGKLSMCNLYMKYWRDPSYYSSSPWKGTVRFDGGGALMNQGIHGIDLMLYIMGEAKVLGAECKTSFHNIEVEDTAVALLEFENGAVGTLQASTCTYPGFERRIELLGSNGCAVLNENRIEKLIIGDKTLINSDSLPKKGSVSNPADMSSEGHARQIANFINAVSGKEELLIDAREGQRAVKLIEQIYKFN